MKQIFKYFAMVAVAVATLGMVSCGDDNNDPGNNGGGNGELPTYTTMEGTSWEGTYATTTNDGYQTYPMIIHWALDFVSPKNGEIMVWFESQAFDPTTFTGDFTYTYDGKNKGHIDTDFFTPDDFTVDAVNKTMEMSLIIHLIHEQNGPEFPYGGMTTLHQVR